MKAEYVVGLIRSKENYILSIPSVGDRIKAVVNIIKTAPIPDGTPIEFAFIETMNVESTFLTDALEMYDRSGKVIVVPNDFSKEEARNVQTALSYIYDLCENNINN